jgi:periplasmic protein TonB
MKNSCFSVTERTPNEIALTALTTVALHWHLRNIRVAPAATCVGTQVVTGVLSLAAHGLLLAFASWGGQGAPQEPPPFYVVLLESSSPSGAPAAAGDVPAPVSPPSLGKKPQAERPKEEARPKKEEPQRLRVAKKERKPRVPAPKLELPSLQTLQYALTASGSTSHLSAPTTPQPESTGGPGDGKTDNLSNGMVSGKGTGPLPVSQVAYPPVLISQVRADYPQRARRRGIEGLVRLEAVLDCEGRVENDVKVLQSIPLLDEAAVNAVRQWRFTPARDHHGSPVQVILGIPIRFVLTE